MAAVGHAYPPMVGTYTSYPPQPPRLMHLKRKSVAQPVLFTLVILALFGLLVQACFIYYLYDNQASEEREKLPQGYQRQIQPTTSSGPSKPMAHLIGKNKPGKDGVMVWETAERNDPLHQSIMHKMKYSDGKVIIQEEGYYSVYSKINFREPNKHMILHEVAKTTPRYPKEIALLRSKRFLRKAENSESSYSYLGGVFHLLKNEAIFVKVNNHTEIILSGPADNYFGAYMV